jgi:hypothetical protein
MKLEENLKLVGDYVKYASMQEELFHDKFSHPFLVLVEMSGHETEEDSNDFFTETKTSVEINSVMDIVHERKLDHAALVFPVVKRPQANPYSNLITIGRASNCDIVIAVNGVSKFHIYLAKSLAEPMQFLAGDVSSKNGTLINGKTIDKNIRCPLNNGDRISLSTVVVLRYFTPSGFLKILKA